MGRRTLRSFLPGLLIASALLLIPQSSQAALDLGFGGTGVWPQIASANSQRWFRFVIDWGEKEFWTLTFSPGGRFIYDLNGDGSRDWSITIAYTGAGVQLVGATGSLTEYGVHVYWLETRKIEVTIGPFAAPIWVRQDGDPNTRDLFDHWVPGGIMCFRPNTIGYIGGPSDDMHEAVATWTHWSSGGQPSVEEERPNYATLPDNDDVLQWYHGAAGDLDPLSVDPADPNNPRGPDNGSGSSRFIFRVIYKTQIITDQRSWAQLMRSRFSGYDSGGMMPSGYYVDLDRAQWDPVNQRFIGARVAYGPVEDSWIFSWRSDPAQDQQGYNVAWNDPQVVLIIDEDYSRPRFMIKENPSDNDPTDGIVYRYEILPTDYQNWVDAVFLFPQDPSFSDPWDAYAAGLQGRPASNNYVAFFCGGHKYEFWATDDIKPVSWWAQGNAAWVQIGRPGCEGRVAIIEHPEGQYENDGFQRVVPIYKDSRPSVQLEIADQPPGTTLQLFPVSTTYQRFDDTTAGAGGYGYPYDSQDPDQYPKVDPVLSAHPFFPLHDQSKYGPTQTDPDMSDTWPGAMRRGVSQGLLCPHAYNSLPLPFNPLANAGEPWPPESPLANNVEAGWIGTNFYVYPGPGSFTGGLPPSANRGPAPYRFTNDGTILPNFVNITPDTDPDPFRGGKWTRSTTFTFRIVYWQSDNVAPRFVRVMIRKAGPGAPSGWVGYTMQKVYPTDNNYADGCVFYYQISAAQLPGGGGPGDYNYYFIASDGTKTCIFPNRPDRYNQPGGGTYDDPGDIGVVADGAGNAPDYYWFRVNTPPTLSGPSVTPTVGKQGQDFVFRVRYQDPDEQVASDYDRTPNPQGHGDRPFKALIYIDLFGNEYGKCTVQAIAGGGTTITYATEKGTLYPDGSLVGKEVEFETGALSGQRFEITGNTGNQITVAAPVAGAAAGDRFRIAEWFVGEMQQVDSADDNYTDGADFEFRTASRVTLEPGVHRYYFEFWDDWGSWLFRDDPNVKVEGEMVRLPTNGWFEGPEVIRNTAPVLTEFRYVPKTSTPGAYDGTTATQFIFYVTYTDPENDPPAFIRVGIDGTASAPAQVFDMTPVDPNDTVYTDGVVYQSPPIRLSEGQHIFRAQCSDGQFTYPPSAGGAVPFAGPPDNLGNPTDHAQGPNVGPNTPPQLAYPSDDQTPGSQPGLTPDIGTTGDSYTFTVIYTDTDRFAGVAGNPPDYVQLYLDGTAYDMQPVDPTDQDYTDGAVFSVTVTGLSRGEHQYFFVASDGCDRARLPADVGSYEVGPIVLEQPAPPQQLVAQDVAPDQGTAIHLQWNASINDRGGPYDVTEYRIYRSTTSGNYSSTPIATVAATASDTYSYTDTTVQKNTDYYYVVTAVIVYGTPPNQYVLESQYSNEAGPVRAIDDIAPQPPTGLTVTAQADGTLKLQWNLSPDDPNVGGAADVTEYYIYRRTATGVYPDPGSPTYQVPAGTTEFVDSNVTIGETYYYVVRAFDGTNLSDPTAEAGATSQDTLGPQVVNQQPAPNATDVPRGTQISFDVTDAGSGIDINTFSMKVQQLQGGSWVDVSGQTTLDQNQMPGRLGVAFTPDQPFDYLVLVRVQVWAKDASGNGGEEGAGDPPIASWTFRIEAPPTYMVAGYVRDENGVGVSGVTVTCGPFSAVTNAQGYYEITGLAAGTYEVRPEKADTAFLPAVKIVSVPPDQIGIDFTAVPGYDISGRITTAGGQGIGGVVVRAGAYEAVTNANGDYVLEDLPAGSYTVVPQLANYTFTPESRDVTITNADVANIDFVGEELRYAVSGKIAKADGTPVEDITVEAYDNTTSPPTYVASAQTNAAGVYTIPDLLPGQYQIKPVETAEYAFWPSELIVDLSGDATGVNFEALPKHSLTLEPGYNFVGLPITPVPDDDPRAVFGQRPQVSVVRWDPEKPNAGGGLGDWVGPLNPGDPLPDIMRVQPARGFWVYVHGAAQWPVTVAGRELSTDATFQVAVAPGWNQLANPWNADMPWSSLGLSEGMPVRTVGFIYDRNTGQYVMVANVAGPGIVDTVPKYSAFWLYALDRTTLSFAPVTASAAPAGGKLKLGDGEWLMQVVVEAGGKRDAATVVGVCSALAGEVENPPRVPGAVDAYLVSDGKALALKVADKPAQRMVWDLEVAVPDGTDEVSVMLPDLSRVPRDMQVLLVDRDAGRTVYMRTQPRYTFKPAGPVRHLQIVVEPRGAGALVVSAAQARQSGGRVAVSFVLSQPAKVTVEVLNIAGRVVRRLAADRAMEAGVAELGWDLRADNGAPVPAGRYLVRIRALGEGGQQVVAVTQVTVRR